MLWKMLCSTLLSMDRTSHKFPIYATQNVQTRLKPTAFYCNVYLTGVGEKTSVGIEIRSLISPVQPDVLTSHHLR